MFCRVFCNKIRRTVTTRNDKKKAVISIKINKIKRKIVIRGKDICNNFINKENVNVEDCIRVLQSKKHMLSSSAENRQSRVWIINTNQCDAQTLGETGKRNTTISFFHESDSYDALPPDYIDRVNNNMRHQCKGNHKSLMFPTTKKHYNFNLCPLNRKEKRIKK